MLFNWVADILGGAVAIAANVTGAQKDYLDWRTSAEGKAYFSQEEENAFWKALASGDTAVIDSGIRQRQDKIDALRHELGFLAVICCLALSLTGCHTYTIPTKAPVIAQEALTSNEITYVVKDMEARTPSGETKTLEGNWHVVSSDFMKIYVRNQDDLIQALTELKKQRDVDRYSSIVVLVLGSLCVMAWLYERATR